MTEMNHVKFILETKAQMCKNWLLSNLVNQYFEYTLYTLDFYTSLDVCLIRATHSDFMVRQQQLPSMTESVATMNEGQLHSKNSFYTKTLKELSNLKAVSNPLSENFLPMLETVKSTQIKRLVSTKMRRRILNTIFATAFGSALICSIVGAAVTAPTVFTVVAAAVALPIKSIGTWLSSILMKNEGDFSHQIEIIAFMQIGTRIAMEDLERIRASVEGLESRMKAAISETKKEGWDEAVHETESLLETIHELSKHTVKCMEKTRMARSLILGQILTTNED